jgi:hypothetical protein
MESRKEFELVLESVKQLDCMLDSKLERQWET